MTSPRLDLDTRLHSVRARLLTLAAPPQDGHPSAGGRGGSFDDLDATVAQIENEALVAERSRLLVMERGLVRALERLAAGEYGVCQDCRGDIPPARLRAVPATELCVECATDQERRAKLAWAGRWEDEDD